VQMMGGKIWIESEPGTGSTFHFTARFRKAGEAPLADAGAQSSVGFPNFEIQSKDSDELVASLLKVGAAGWSGHSVSRDGRLRILVAEDNAINQTLATRYLRKLGHEPTVVSNGKEAVDAVLKGGFHMVLMDVQMPEMDGFEATAAIREWEGKHGGYVPIVAMTAHAMKGDRQRCLDAGMDEYLTKPVERQTLGAMIDAMHGKNQPRKAVHKAEDENVDLQEMLTLFDGDEELLGEVAGLFLDVYPEQMGQIQTAIASSDAGTLERTAHSLKGAAANFGAKDVAACAQRLEQMGRSGQLQGAESAGTELESTLDRLATVLSGIGVRAQA
ncbi:MAG: response regulator, partial [Terriglobia bacterium]